jgi:hypothetical protein
VQGKSCLQGEETMRGVLVVLAIALVACSSNGSATAPPHSRAPISSTATASPTPTTTSTPNSVATPPPTAAPRPPTHTAVVVQPFTCTQIIGFSQTRQWWLGTGTQNFQTAINNPTQWQGLFVDGASIDHWANPNDPAWNTGLFNPCSFLSTDPDRVLLDVSGDYHSDLNFWITNMKAAITNIHNKYPNVRQIILQPVVGGPRGGSCPTSDPASQFGTVRATYNFPFISQAIGQTASAANVIGNQPTVDVCANYLDWVGHLDTTFSGVIGTRIAQYYNTHSSTG